MAQAIFRPIGLNAVKIATIADSYVIGASIYKAATIGREKQQTETNGERCSRPAG